MILHLENPTTYYDVHALTGFSSGSTVANATDEATAIALVNDLKVKVNDIVSALKS